MQCVRHCLKERCFSIADFEHSAFANDRWQDKGIHHVNSTQGFRQKGRKKAFEAANGILSLWSDPLIKHYKWHPRDVETLKQRAGILLETSLHKISAPHNKPLKCLYYIMYYDFKSADISGCCTLISKPNGLFRPSNSCSGWLWSSWWIRPTSISSKMCLIPDQSFGKNWFGF